LAVCMACLEVADLSQLKAPIHLALSYDEEVGCIGVDGLIGDMIEHVDTPRWVVIGEPTNMEVVRAHKSINVFETTIIGKAAHSSQPHRGGGAIFAAARMIEHLYQLGEAKRTAGGTSGAEPPYTTVQVGLIEGGTAVNILPSRCSFKWEYRALPDEDPDEIIHALTQWVDANVLPDLKRHAPEASIQTKAIARVPPLMASPDSGIEDWTRGLSGVVAGGSGEVAFATEGGNFKAFGLPSIVCGPGSIDQAHQPDEFVEIAQLEACVSMVSAIIEHQSN
ncbi:MAG TPA: M20/M25/M40 family metallo-hydrolase, partial [Wenzhouxiangella sp.]